MFALFNQFKKTVTDWIYPAHAKVQMYIEQINRGDRINTIQLSSLNYAQGLHPSIKLEDADIAPLFEALHKNPSVAGGIKELDLSYNNLKHLNLSDLSALQEIDLSNNQLEQLDGLNYTAIKNLDVANNPIEASISNPRARSLTA